MLNRLVYASYSVETMNERMIQTVLEQSRLSNAEHGVTGMLWGWLNVENKKRQQSIKHVG